MANSIKTFNNLRVDIFQAMKRAFMRRGVLRAVDEPPRSSNPRNIESTVKSNVDSLPAEKNDEMPAEAPAEVKEEPQDLGKEEKKAEQGSEEIIELTERTQDVLFEAHTVFPFTLFPDTLTLDREKLTIAERYFWRVAKITSVPVSEILSCQASVGPFFGSIHLVFSFFADNERTVKFLWREDATKLQRMLHGYIIAHKRQINTTNISAEDLKVMLKEIGQGASE